MRKLYDWYCPLCNMGGEYLLEEGEIPLCPMCDKEMQRKFPRTNINNRQKGNWNSVKAQGKPLCKPWDGKVSPTTRWVED